MSYIMFCPQVIFECDDEVEFHIGWHDAVGFVLELYEGFEFPTQEFEFFKQPKDISPRATFFSPILSEVVILKHLCGDLFFDWQKYVVVLI